MRGFIFLGFILFSAAACGFEQFESFNEQYPVKFRSESYYAFQIRVRDWQERKQEVEDHNQQIVDRQEVQERLAQQRMVDDARAMREAAQAAQARRIAESTARTIRETANANRPVNNGGANNDANGASLHQNPQENMSSGWLHPPPQNDSQLGNGSSNAPYIPSQPQNSPEAVAPARASDSIQSSPQGDAQAGVDGRAEAERQRRVKDQETALALQAGIAAEAQRVQQEKMEVQVAANDIIERLNVASAPEAPEVSGDDFRKSLAEIAALSDEPATAGPVTGVPPPELPPETASGSALDEIKDAVKRSADYLENKAPSKEDVQSLEDKAMTAAEKLRDDMNKEVAKAMTGFDNSVHAAKERLNKMGDDVTKLLDKTMAFFGAAATQMQSPDDNPFPATTVNPLP